MYKEYLHDSYNNSIYTEDESYHYIILTFDLSNASSSSYREIDEQLNKFGFKKIIRAKSGDDKYPYNPTETPKNTYIGIASRKIYKNLKKVRDDAEKVLRDILDDEFKWGKIDAYNYLVFIAKEWSWAAGQIKR